MNIRHRCDYPVGPHPIIATHPSHTKKIIGAPPPFNVPLNSKYSSVFRFKLRPELVKKAMKLNIWRLFVNLGCGTRNWGGVLKYFRALRAR